MGGSQKRGSIGPLQYHINMEFGLFTNPTGYGKENIGRNAKFLQGPMTEGYMVEEIVESLRHADPLFCKLQNHKPDGSVYQQCLCLTPVFNVDGERQKQIRLLYLHFTLEEESNNPFESYTESRFFPQSYHVIFSTSRSSSNTCICWIKHIPERTQSGR